jgi:hypothetical protein
VRAVTVSEFEQPPQVEEVAPATAGRGVLGAKALQERRQSLSVSRRTGRQQRAGENLRAALLMGLTTPLLSVGTGRRAASR